MKAFQQQKFKIDNGFRVTGDSWWQYLKNDMNSQNKKWELKICRVIQKHSGGIPTEIHTSRTRLGSPLPKKNKQNYVVFENILEWNYSGDGEGKSRPSFFTDSTEHISEIYADCTILPKVQQEKIGKEQR